MLAAGRASAVIARIFRVHRHCQPRRQRHPPQSTAGAVSLWKSWLSHNINRLPRILLLNQLKSFVFQIGTFGAKITTRPGWLRSSMRARNRPISSGLSSSRLWTASFHPSLLDVDWDCDRDDEIEALRDRERPCDREVDCEPEREVDRDRDQPVEEDSERDDPVDDDRDRDQPLDQDRERPRFEPLWLVNPPLKLNELPPERPELLESEWPKFWPLE
jgi:hypothetical protein